MSVPIVTPAVGCAGGAPWLRFYYADQLIEVERAARTRAVSRILIKVDPDCRVRVSAPETACDAEVLRALKLRGRWIYTQLRAFRSQQAQVRKRQYISGESYFYLGKRYVLKVQEAPEAVQQVRLLGGQLQVSVRRLAPEKVRELLLQWYKARAREVFSRRLEAVLPHALWVREKPPLRLLSMQTQWGSCSPAGRITLNPHLVKAPSECIDYVLLHELCHLAEHNHSERFYRLLHQVMPHWEKTKQRLDNNAAAFLNDVWSL